MLWHENLSTMSWHSAVRYFTLRDKGGGLAFGYGKYGPIPTYAADADGITFQDNILVCNPDLTGNAGTVYVHSRHGGVMALTMNSIDFDYTYGDLTVRYGRSCDDAWKLMLFTLNGSTEKFTR